MEPLFTDAKVYYRLYGEDGLLPCQQHFRQNDQCLGRVSVIQIPPPHTAESIKRSLRKAENISDTSTIALYSDCAGESDPLDDEIQVPISSGSGPGSDPLNAMALMVTPEKFQKAPSTSGREQLPQFHFRKHTHQRSR